MNKFIHTWGLLLVIVLFFASFLRLYKLNSIPISLNPDETAIGYTAFALLTTGADEWGNHFPLSLKSFGDWKLPVYPIITMLPIGLLGANEFAVRLPSALAGILGTYLIFLISFILFKKKEVAFFSAVLFAFSPWGIYFSRIAYEVNVGTTLFLGGLLAFLYAIEDLQEKKNLLFLSALLLGLTVFTYHSFLLFTPLFTLGIVVIYRKKLLECSYSKWAGIVLCLFIIGSGVVLLQGSAKKVSSVSIFNDENIIYNRVDKLRGDKAPKNQIIERVLHTKYIGSSYQILQNYLASFSPSFLFDKGGEKLQHNLGYFGNMYLFEALLLGIGIAGLFWNREKNLSLIVLWFLLSPIPSAITKDAPNSARLFIMLPVLTLIGAYGGYCILQYSKGKSFVKPMLGIIGVFLYVLNVVYFLDAYYIHMNTQRARFLHFGYREVVELTNKYPTWNIVMRGPDNFPYISFLFYTKYNPKQFIQEVKYYPATSEGFLLVKSFGRYHFVETIDYSKLQPHTLYIDNTRLGDHKHSILLPSGEPIFGYYVNDK